MGEALMSQAHLIQKMQTTSDYTPQLPLKFTLEPSRLHSLWINPFIPSTVRDKRPAQAIDSILDVM